MAVESAPAIAEHRLVGDGRSAFLICPDGEIDWWCAPDFDSPPLLWSLLDGDGAAARWVGARPVSASPEPAGRTVRTVVEVGGNRVECWDGLLRFADDEVALLRLVRSSVGAVELEHEAALGGFDWPGLEWGGTSHVTATGGRIVVDGRTARATVVAPPDGWAALVISLGPRPVAADAVRLADRLGGDGAEPAAAARLPRHHPERAADALAVLRACTYSPTGAVMAAVTTSLPEAPGADRNFDYRGTWLRDASLAVSVASLLGQKGAATRYLSFARDASGRPVSDIRGRPLPAERSIGGVAGWAGSQPVRVGNAARDQVQCDGPGLLLEAVSVHLQTGGSLDHDTWATVCRIADGLAAEQGEPGPTNGIWEFREPHPFVSDDIGRWLALDRAVWIARGWRPTARRSHWLAARDRVRERVVAAMGEDGSVPQWYGQDPPVADASALMAVVFGLLRRRDERAARLVDWVTERLGTGPFLYRYQPGTDDGFRGQEAAFVPVSWWAVDALAAVGRTTEAVERADAMCAALPRLLAEEFDVDSGQSLGNVPLVWSHAEAARTMYLLDAAAKRERFGSAGLWAWRLGRYAQLRFGRG